MISILTQALIAIGVTLGWEASPDPDATGYKIYLGTESHNYTQNFDAGNVLSYRINALTPSKTYYFAATAYDLTEESGFSDELIYTVNAIDMRLTLLPDRIITVNAFEGGQFEIEQTKDFASNMWSNLYYFTASKDASTIPITMDQSEQFFRLKKVGDSVPYGNNVISYDINKMMVSYDIEKPKALLQSVISALKYKPGSHPKMERGKH